MALVQRNGQEFHVTDPIFIFLIDYAKERLTREQVYFKHNFIFHQTCSIVIITLFYKNINAKFSCYLLKNMVSLSLLFHVYTHEKQQNMPCHL
jgi:hypothetical protein